MSFKSGTLIVESMIESLKINVSDVSVRKEIYRDLFNIMEIMDWDSYQEVLELDDAFDEVAKEFHPDYISEYDQDEY